LQAKTNKPEDRRIFVYLFGNNLPWTGWLCQRLYLGSKSDVGISEPLPG
jgi:hypothetical protein